MMYVKTSLRKACNYLGEEDMDFVKKYVRLNQGSLICGPSHRQYYFAYTWNINLLLFIKAMRSVNSFDSSAKYPKLSRK